MAQDKKEHREPISTEYKDHTHTGTLVVRGTRKLSVSVEYQGKSRTDSRSWGTDAEEQYNLRVMGQALLLQIIADC